MLATNKLRMPVINKIIASVFFVFMFKSFVASKVIPMRNGTRRLGTIVNKTLIIAAAAIFHHLFLWGEFLLFKCS